ncbi:hypothetical protein CVT25_013276 [Psilocybe cyanescens]|uniref:Uncharacterized protein n=1 Tax=Psilocybe cyanescens TaxID=93625 RepID=A0A409XHS8_PSICY|nr:hypothetical protein CVT25_013276 [Psilocybe cyanescens]
MYKTLRYSSYLLLNSPFQILLFQQPPDALFWLDASLAGLKLNTQLSRFYVTTLIDVIDTWDSIIPPLALSLFTTLGFLAAIGGFTLLVSLSSDCDHSTPLIMEHLWNSVSRPSSPPERSCTCSRV